MHDIVGNMHGGQIDLSTQPGQGTTFSIRLPMAASSMDLAGAPALSSEVVVVPGMDLLN